MNRKSQHLFPIKEKVVRAMEKRGWSQSDLARASKVKNNVISRFISENAISADNLVLLLATLDILNVSPQDEKDIINISDNVVFIPRKHPELYEILDLIDKSDDPKVIETARNRLQGVLLMTKGDVRTLSERMDRIEDKIDQLIKLRASPKKKAK